MSPRLGRLLARERDGELTALEREELDRLSRLEPSVRRERATWAQLEEILAAPEPSALLRRHQIARRMAERARGEAHRDSGGAIFRPFRSFRLGPRWILALAAGCVVVAMAVDRTSPKPVTVVPLSEVAAVGHSPVEVRLHGKAELDPNPVDIKF